MIKSILATNKRQNIVIIGAQGNMLREGVKTGFGVMAILSLDHDHSELRTHKIVTNHSGD